MPTLNQYGEPVVVVEVIPERLYWMAYSVVPIDTAKSHYFSVDNDLAYDPFLFDFGPLNLGMIYQYCKIVELKMNDPAYASKRLVHCCSLCPKKATNAASLICMYRVLVDKIGVDVAFAPFERTNVRFPAFRDASNLSVCSFKLTIKDCLAGVVRAAELGWFDLKTFDLKSYQALENVDVCGMNWIIPNKFLAFAGSKTMDLKPEEQNFASTPETHLAVFQQEGIQHVIRLNSEQYDRSVFTKAGIGHSDLFFKDGTCPSEDIVAKFFSICEQVGGPIAVHCKAGLGRTCTLIGLYAMRHYKFRARAFIGWSRMCRPGSILGQQQHYFVAMEQRMFEACTFKSTSSYTFPVAIPFVGDNCEDSGQGERLCDLAARRNERRNEENQIRSTAKSEVVQRSETQVSSVYGQVAGVVAVCDFNPVLLGRVRCDQSLLQLRASTTCCEKETYSANACGHALSCYPDCTRTGPPAIQTL